MKNIAYFNPETRTVCATASMQPKMDPDPAGDPWVPIPDGVDIDDPAEWTVAEDDTLVFVGRPVAVADVTLERDRRLAAGFDYDFQDTRGVHRIGTTPGDMEKWVGEVTPIAQAFLNLNMPGSQIEIKTETDVVAVTALEWQSVLAAAMAMRQPIYQGYFALKAMHPIPDNFKDDQYWTISS